MGKMGHKTQWRAAAFKTKTQKKNENNKDSENNKLKQKHKK